jgi:hypothetical protein
MLNNYLPQVIVSDLARTTADGIMGGYRRQLAIYMSVSKMEN